MKQLINNKIIQFSFVLIIGLFFGWLFFSNGSSDQEHIHSEAESKETIWTCSMHPQIRQNEPGDCPICGMELIPLAEDEDNTEQNNFSHTMSASAAALANIQTEQVKYQVPQHEIFLTGKIQSNEKNLSVITADYSGRLENLFIDFTGESVQKGEKLATIYSPELVRAQKELLEAAKTKDRNPSLYNAVKKKLRLWKITDKQIKQIELSNEIVTELDIYADISGIVLSRKVSKGDYVNKGEILFEISDLSSVWVKLDAYESDLPWVDVGDKVEFTTQSLPGKTFTSTVTFIDPLINDQSRTASARAELNNPGLQLKPGMFVDAVVKSNQNQTSKSEKKLIIPKTSLLWTGKRSIVFVKFPNSESPKFEMREIVLGARTGNNYIVEQGLSKGEEIVTNGVFAVDAATQLSGKFSMMNRPESKRLDVPSKFKDQLTSLIEKYFALKDALVDSDLSKTKSTGNQLISSLKQIDMKLLEDDAHHKWMEIENTLSSSLKSLTETEDIEEARKYFEDISEAAIESADFFGVNKEIVYVQFCPMAFDDKGASWLSDSDEILNPYFGDMMLNCGEVTKKISAVDSYKESDDKSDQPMGHQH